MKLEVLNYDDIIELDRQRVLSNAKSMTKEKPQSVTSAVCSRSSGNRHDYYSEGDYWWPSPTDPQGPYIRRDGYSNPDYFHKHRQLMRRLSIHVATLAVAYRITSDKTYADHAAQHLRTWFLNSETFMNPNLQYSQAIHGHCTGRGIGIIDTIHLVEVVLAIIELENSGMIEPCELFGLKAWFRKYLTWITTHQYGIRERDNMSNHGTCWLLQVSAFASFLDDEQILSDCHKRFKEVILHSQMATDGSFPEELKRTKPYGYSIFNVDIMAGICQLLSSSDQNLWTFQLPDGRGMSKAMYFLYPFLKDKNSWPYPHDVMYYDKWPVRQPCLLFAGIALEIDEYIELWKKLDPDPTDSEVIRNFPIRQPLLWIKS